MSDTSAGGQPGDARRGSQAGQPGAEPAADEGPAVPHRVIGTPPPAQARTLLGQADDEPQAQPRELPAEVSDPERAKRAERVVAACFIIAMLAGFAFIVCYALFQVHTVNGALHSNLVLGSTMGLAFLGLGVGATIWVRQVMPVVEQTEERHPLASSPEDRAAFAKTFEEGTEASGFVSRPLLRRTLIAATVPVALAPIVLLRDMGPLPGTSLENTVWRRGMRLLTAGSNRPLTPGDFDSPGGMITVVPEGFQNDDDALAKAAVVIIKFAPGVLQPPTVLNWTVDGIVAYSKICTHLGCPAALYEQTTQHILCPCHQSTFDAPRGAQVLFGPATRPLPQLPMTVNSAGYLVARSDFHEPVGPSYWERS
ncbi:MAG TPA: Rieske 2Fe-2S domain-containing protein [Streptosporangiaceae bacterium]|nr:Rieske 2Fe-2S domain-containing protein [Streptosporangiaceae bacterium]